MRVHHVPVRRTAQVQLPVELIEKLPTKVCLCTTSQFLQQLPNLQAQLEAVGKSVTLHTPRHTFHAGQVLGCSTEKVEGVDCFLFVGEGLFHPQALAYANEVPVYLYDPVAQTSGIVDRALIELRKKKREAGIKLFYHSSRIGVLISTKSGQKDINALDKLREKYPSKQFYAFLGNTLDIQGLENYPFVEVWLNTACPRIGYDDIEKSEKPLINAEDVLTNHLF